MNKPVVLVSGGAHRIGAALCRAFARHGWRVVVHCNQSRATAMRLARELGGAEVAAVLQADLRTEAAGVIARAFDCFGRLDGLVNNASNYHRRGLDELTEDALETARKQQEKEAFNPYSKELMKQLIEKCMKGKRQISAEELPIHRKEDLMAILSAVAYAKDNGYSIEIQDGYLEVNGLLLHRFLVENEGK